MDVDGGTEMHSPGVRTPSVKRKQSMDNSEENATPSPIYAAYMYEKKRKIVDHTDPFATRDFVVGLDSPKYGSVTKVIEDLFSRRKQMTVTPYKRFPALTDKSLELKPGINPSIVHEDKKHERNGRQMVVIIDSDEDDEPTCQTPSKPCQDLIVLNKPKLEDDDVDSKKKLDLVTFVEPNVKDCKSLEDNMDSEKKQGALTFVEPSLEEYKILEDGDMDSEKKHDLVTFVEPNVKDCKSLEDNIDSEKKHDLVTFVEPNVKDCKSLEDNIDSEKKHGTVTLVEPNLEEYKILEDGDMDSEKKQGTVTILEPIFAEVKSLEKKHDTVAIVKPNVKENKRLEDDLDSEKKQDIVTFVEPIVEEDKRLKDDDVDGEKKQDMVTFVEPIVEEEKRLQDDDVDGKKEHDKSVHVGVEEDNTEDTDEEESDIQYLDNFDGLGDIWKEMTDGLESSKDINSSSNGKARVEKECDHSFIFKEDIGSVCRVCGIIDRSIESIIEFQRPKVSKSMRTYCYEPENRSGGSISAPVLDGVKLPETNFSASELTAHPRHRKQMKPHQIEGFNFLLSNLVCDNPGGCILAHAPGSGKTFMLISFIQSFMAKYPDARPLVILPRGILGTWKKEFNRWQVENLPLFDFYSVKADSRTQQLQVLKKWANQRSILFMGYQQFSSIVCDNDTSSIPVSCQEILLTYPSLIILDEGHTPRNQDTNILTSLEKIQTPRKVVLSGTLYQNHVREVFNILNLVRPKFLRMESSKILKRRILSKVPIESRKNLVKKSTDSEFYEVVEHCLLKDENFRRKVTVIEDLREMTSKVLHYYKGDSLDELPGLVDFSVFLNLSPKQKREVHELRKISKKFKLNSDGSAIYVHPGLKSVLKKNKDRSDEIDKIDELLERIDERDGVKAKFYLNLLRLCVSEGEKLLVFSQYLIPLKFLLRLTVKTKNWSLGKEMFMITGDHDNDEREIAMESFNSSPDSRVFFGSIRACGEGISLVGASRIIILDIHLNPSVTRQAIGRAFRPGQMKKVYTYRLIAAESPEAEDHVTCFKKESIAKMWFEWDEYCGHHDFEMETTSVEDCGDEFLGNSCLNEDVTAIFKR